jgi:hypothetical protein
MDTKIYEQTDIENFEYGESRKNCTPLEKLLQRRFFIGKAGCYNIPLPNRYMPSIEQADKLADEIRKLPIRKALGEEISELEKMALSLLTNY